MKFSEVVKGTRAEIEVEIPSLSTKTGKPVKALVRPLVELEEEDILAAALKDARAAGIEAPQRGMELYDAAVMVHTIAKSYLDVDSPKDDRLPFFDGGPSDIRANFGTDEICYLFERQEAHQNDCSPSIRKVTAEELYMLTTKIAAADSDGPFVELAPALRCRWARIMAKLLVSSLGDKWPPSSTTTEIH